MFVNTFQAYRNNAGVLKFTKKLAIVLIVCNFLAICRSYPTVWAYEHISASKSMLIINISPLLVVLIGGLFLSEKVTYINYVVGVVAV